MPVEEVVSRFHIWLIYFLITIYAICYQIQAPIEPFLVDKLVKGGAAEAAVAYSKVTSFFSVMQGVGSLLMGLILDKFGYRFAFIVNFVACALQYYTLSVSTSLNLLFLSKMPGMMMGGFLCAQTAVATFTADGPERVKALGRLTTAYTVGATLGLYIGGYLGASGDYYYTARLATYGSLASCLLVMLLPPKLSKAVVQSAKQTPKTKEKEKEKEKEKDVKDSKDANTQVVDSSWFANISYIIMVAGPLLSVKISTGLANNMARSAQPLMLKNRLGFNEADMGLVMSLQTALAGFSNAFLLVPLTAFLGGEITVVIRNCVLIMGSIYALQSSLFHPTTSPLVIEKGSMFSGYLFVGFALFLSMFQYSLSTGITAGTQALVPKTMVGTLMGVEHSIFAVAGMFGPLVGTYIFNSFDISGLSIFCVYFSVFHSC
jgi:MFS family permease